MKRIITIAIPLALVLAASGPAALAQGTPGKRDAGRTSSPGYEVTEEIQRYREVAGVMRDLSKQMNKIEQEMLKGKMPPERRKRMKQELEEMSDIMRRMSWLADRPAMNDPEVRKQTGEMRRQMDKLMHMQP